MRMKIGYTITDSPLGRLLVAATERGVSAVAQACASNRVSVVIPCHRVVGADGRIGGYRWGVERKEKLLARERGQNP